MNVTLAPGASLRRIAEIVRHAVLLGPDAWEGGSLPERSANSDRPANLLPTDRDVVELFTLLRERQTPYLLVGGIAMLRYVEAVVTAQPSTRLMSVSVPPACQRRHNSARSISPNRLRSMQHLHAHPYGVASTARIRPFTFNGSDRTMIAP